MATVLAGGTMSLDGFIAHQDGSTEHLFDWFSDGDTEITFPNGKMSIHVSPASALIMRDISKTAGAIVLGRQSFELAQGWGGSHPLGVPLFVLGHSIPEGWPRDDADFTFVTDSLESAIEQAKKAAGEKMVILAGASIAQQALKAGMVDEIELDLVPVLLGKGIRLFEYLGIELIKLERTFAVPAPGVTHLRFRVLK